MSSKQVILFISFLGILSAYFYTVAREVLYRTPPLPNLEVEPWWGPENDNVEDTTIRPFTINISDAILKDLKTRLSNTLPFQPPLEGIQQQYGINTNHLKNVIDFWKTEYNWREREKILNKYPQFTVSIQGLKIHYLHVKPTETRGLKVVPLLILHGWPSSVREFHDILPHLTTPQEGRDLVFEVVAPSLPGYAFSEPAVRPGLGPKDMAIVFKNFMKRLGFEKYYLQGGDWGGLIVHNIATLFPEHIIGVALRDSPVGLAAYLLEKYPLWTNPEWKNLEDGGLTKKFKLVDLLDNVMIYWVTGCITTSMRLYAECFSKEYFALHMASIPTTVPSACARFSHELVYQPEAVLRDKFVNLVHIADYEGGHFAAAEEPEVLAKDLYMFVEKVENSIDNNINSL